MNADPRSPERGQYSFLQDIVKRVAYETLSQCLIRSPRVDRLTCSSAAAFAAELRSVGAVLDVRSGDAAEPSAVLAIDDAANEAVYGRDYSEMLSRLGMQDLEQTVVELGAGDVVTGFQEAPRLPHWVSCGVYVLGQEAIDELFRRLFG